MTFEEYPFAQYEKVVSEVCLPLERFDISTLVYVRLYFNGERSVLTNNARWEQHFLANKYYLLPVLGKLDYPNEVYLDKLFLLSSCWPKIPDLINSMHQFNIGQTLAYIEKFERYTEYVFFSTEWCNELISNFYLNNKSLFINFVNYFRGKLANEIENSDARKFALPLADKQHMYASFEVYDADIKEQISAFKKDITLSEIFVKDIGKVSFSSQERRCIYYMCRHLTARDIAKQMCLSSRTVEHYIENIKAKLSVKNKFDAIKLLRDLWIK